MARAKTARPKAVRRAAKKRTKKAPRRNGAGAGAATGPVIKLTLEDRRWFENVMLKRDLIQREAQTKLAAVDEDAVELAKTLSQREGVDISQYDLDWKALTGKPKTAVGNGKPKTVPEVTPEMVPEAVPEEAPRAEA
jgi:hypothetical protein